jgi:thiamine-monophosphate kinase
VALNEFSLIKQYFADATQKRQDVIVDIGDDCAVLCCPEDSDIAISIDT